MTYLEGGAHKRGEKGSEVRREIIIYIHAECVCKFRMKPVILQTNRKHVLNKKNGI